MALARVRIADTEAIARYVITRTGTKIEKIFALNCARAEGKWAGRRKINLDLGQLEKLASIICADLEDKIHFPDRYSTKYTRI